jgi:hypothetical protein
MDTVALVEYQIDDGQRLLDRLDEKGIVVRAACWVKPVQEDRWSLYIATPSVDENGTLQAYRQLNGVLRSLGDDWVSSSEVVLVGEKHPLVPDALDILRRFPHRRPIQSPRSLLGGIPVEDVFVYPTGKTPVTIYSLVFQGDPGGVVHLSLEPHNPHSKKIVENKGQRNEYIAQTGIEGVVAAPPGAKLKRDQTGQMLLVWDDLHGKRVHSSANEVWTLAKLELHGFRFYPDNHAAGIQADNADLPPPRSDTP